MLASKDVPNERLLGNGRPCLDYVAILQRPAQDVNERPIADRGILWLQ
jgi:hypothetical protein